MSVADSSHKPAVEEKSTVATSKTGLSGQARSDSANTATRPSRRPSRSNWSWTLINFWLDSALLINFVSLVWVSTVIQFIFPPASIAQGWMLWGYGIDAWMGCQFALTAIFTVGILTHLMLHWSWVCGVFFSRIWRQGGTAAVPDDGTRTIYGVGLMIVLLNVLGVLVAAAALSMQPPV